MYKEKIVSKLMIQDTNKDIFDGLFEMLNPCTNILKYYDNLRSCKCFREMLADHWISQNFYVSEMWDFCWMLVYNMQLHWGVLSTETAKTEVSCHCKCGAIDYVAFHLGNAYDDVFIQKKCFRSGRETLVYCPIKINQSIN